jgi:hypothetical protein
MTDELPSSCGSEATISLLAWYSNTSTIFGMVQIESSVASAIDDEDDDDLVKCRLITTEWRDVVSFCYVKKPRADATIGNLDTHLQAVEKFIAWRYSLARGRRFQRRLGLRDPQRCGRPLTGDR